MKPDDIPEDIMRLAEDYYLDAVVMTTEDEPRAMVLMLARAILAERDRCAKIAGLYGDHPNEVVGMAADEIAAAIRQPREGNGG